MAQQRLEGLTGNGSKPRSTRYTRVVYNGQTFEIQPSSCPCPAPEIVPIGRPTPGSQALPAFPHGTRLVDVLNWGGKLVQSEHGPEPAKKKRSGSETIIEEAHKLLGEIRHFENFRAKISQEVATTTYSNALAQIQHFQELEGQLRQQLGSIQQAGRKLKGKHKWLEHAHWLQVSNILGHMCGKTSANGDIL